jgi:hypothetical protein
MICVEFSVQGLWLPYRRNKSSLTFGICAHGYCILSPRVSYCSIGLLHRYRLQLDLFCSFNYILHYQQDPIVCQPMSAGEQKNHVQFANQTNHFHSLLGSSPTHRDLVFRGSQHLVVLDHIGWIFPSSHSFPSSGLSY